MVDTIPAQRIVPGAPPPAPISKSQKKKRKTAQTKDDVPVAIPDSTTAALVETAPEPSDIAKGAVAEELVAAPQEASPEISAEKPKSPTIELFNKRIKLQTKKISRIATYSSKSPSELNEDQKKSVASLPAIHAIVRELEELKKSLEALETEEAKRNEEQRIEEEQAVKERISQAVATAMSSLQQRVSALLSLLQLAGALAAGDPTTFSLVLNQTERDAIFSLGQALTGIDSPKKDESITGLLSASGEFDGVSYIRLLEIIDSYRNPPPEPEPTPIAETPIKEIIETASVEVETPDQAQPVVENAPPAAGSFHFMQESELEGPSFEEGAEWVERPQEAEVRIPVAEGPSALTIADTGVPLETNGLVPASEEPPATAVSAALDWAADDAVGLPSINSLHAKFGTSGAATPEASAQEAAPVKDEAAPVPTVNGQDRALGASPEVDADGFVKAKSGRGRQTDPRGRGRGGFRGDRGGPKGGYQGGYRGRGGPDSFSGVWRGDGGRGFRGDRGRGDFRGGRGGEFRGRGRGNRGGKSAAEPHEQSS